MITKYRAVLKTSDNFELDTNMSSLFHGVISEIVSRDFVEEIHQNSLRPYSQFLFKSKNEEWVWEINTLNICAKNEIIDRLKNETSLYIKHKNVYIGLPKSEILETNYNEIFEKNYFEGNKPRIVNLSFLTPTAFKSNGEYINYPNTDLLINSVLNKYDYCSDITNLNDEKTIELLKDSLKIIGYNLRTKYFYLENVKIPAFVGNIKIKIKGNQNIVNLVNMLFEFAQYSGVGIKTALGMGAVKKY